MLLLIFLDDAFGVFPCLVGNNVKVESGERKVVDRIEKQGEIRVFP